MNRRRRATYGGRHLALLGSVGLGLGGGSLFRGGLLGRCLFGLCSFTSRLLCGGGLLGRGLGGRSSLLYGRVSWKQRVESGRR